MNKENKHVHDENCNHEQEHETLTLTLDDGKTMECIIIDIFDIDGQSYIALLHPLEETALLYRFEEIGDDAIDLINIESDDEFEKVSKYMNELFAEEN